MARTRPVHAGYHILSGSGAGSNGNRIHVWVEYAVGQADVAQNRTWLTAYFYAALNPNYTSSTSYYTGLNSTFSVDGQAATGVTGGAYDFTDEDNVNLLGSFSGWVEHDAEGEKTVLFEGSFTTASSYISGGGISAEAVLPTIPRAAVPSAGAAQLGDPCRITWTPALVRHSFRLIFSLGSWKHTTARIAPGTTRPYTYSDLTLPLALAQQFAGAEEAMTVTLETYDGDRLLGSATGSFSVTVPENDNTRPRVTATLQPEGNAFPGMYVQLLSKVSAQVTAEDPLGAEITGYTISVGGDLTAGTVSDYLEKEGAVTVIVTARNSRGFTGSWQETIVVIPYGSPRLLTAAACRCLSDGTADPGGTFLCLNATWSYSPVEGENTCCLRWRYQQEAGQWSAWASIAATDHVETGPIAGVVLERDAAYTVELEVTDQAGGAAPAAFSIPVEQVYMHRTRNAMGLGGYVQESDMLDVYWNLQARQSINGVYIRSKRLFATKQMQLQTKFPAFAGAGDERQAIWLFGNDNGALIQGIIGISDNGGLSWEGTTGVELSADAVTGMVTITFPNVGYDRFVFISPDPIELV